MDAPRGVRDPFRLAKLRATGLLDSASDESFDRLARLACRVLSTPIALVSLVDEERQFFKSAVGLSEPWASRRETPLSHSYCQHVVAAQAPLEINDARQHPMTAGSPAIEDLAAVAYLGVPIVVGDAVLGSFCVIDTRARAWNPADLETLRDLGAVVTREIELQAAARQAKRLEELAQYEALIEKAPDLLAVVNGDGTIRYVSPSARPVLGYEVDVLVGKTLVDLIHPAEAAILQAEFERTAETPGHAVPFQVRFRHADGGWRLLEGIGTNAFADPHIRGLVFNCRDVTDLRQTTERLHQAQIQLDRLLSVVPAFFYSLRLEDNSPTWVGGNVKLILGYEPGEVLNSGNWWLERVHPDDRPQALANQERLRTEGRFSHVYRFQHRDGSYHWIRDTLGIAGDPSGRPTEVVGLWLDITEQKKLEEAVREGERLSAVGRLAAGVAHELRNPLSVIVARVEMLARLEKHLSGSPAEQFAKYVTSLSDAVDRMRRIVDSLSLSSKPPKPEPRPLDVPLLLQAVRELVSYEARRLRVAVALDVAAELPPVLADRSSMIQVLLNLATNAVEAMSGSGGELLLRGDRFDDGVRVQVVDSGPGIPAAVLARIWEPFFTTKAEGTGLGLSIVRAIVEEQPGARIEVQSAAGKGTTFTLLLSSPR